MSLLCKLKFEFSRATSKSCFHFERYRKIWHYWNQWKCHSVQSQDSSDSLFSIETVYMTYNIVWLTAQMHSTKVWLQPVTTVSHMTRPFYWMDLKLKDTSSNPLSRASGIFTHSFYTLLILPRCSDRRANSNTTSTMSDIKEVTK